MDDNKNSAPIVIPEKKKKKKLFDFGKKNVQLIIAAVLGIVAIIIYISTLGFSGSDSSTSAAGEVTAKQLESILSKIDGAGKVSVVITYRDSGKTVYATDTQVTTKTVTNGQGTTETIEETTSVVLVGGKPLVEKVLSPEIMGVVIVSSGAKNAAVRLEMIRAAETLLDVSGDVIKVFAMD